MCSACVCVLALHMCVCVFSVNSVCVRDAAMFNYDEFQSIYLLFSRISMHSVNRDIRLSIKSNVF